VDVDAYTLLHHIFAYVFCVHSFQDLRHPAANAVSRIAAASSRRRDSDDLPLNQGYDAIISTIAMLRDVLECGDDQVNYN